MSGKPETALSAKIIMPTTTDSAATVSAAPLAGSAVDPGPPLHLAAETHVLQFFMTVFH